MSAIVEDKISFIRAQSRGRYAGGQNHHQHQHHTDDFDDFEEGMNTGVQEAMSNNNVHMQHQRQRQMYCACCLAIRWTCGCLYQLAWLMVGLPLRCIETVFISIPMRTFLLLLNMDTISFLTGAVFSFLVCFAVIMPIVRQTNSDASSLVRSGLCSTFVGTLSYVFIQVLYALLVLHRWITPRQLERARPPPPSLQTADGDGYTASNRSPSLISQAHRWLRAPNAAGYLGILLGLLVAFPITTLEQHDWCEPSRQEAIMYICMSISALIAAHTPVQTIAISRQDLEFRTGHHPVSVMSHYHHTPSRHLTHPRQRVRFRRDSVYSVGDDELIDQSEDEMMPTTVVEEEDGEGELNVHNFHPQRHVRMERGISMIGRFE